MTDAADAQLPIAFAPLTPDRWPDLEALFGERGGCGGCWCMTWRLSRAQYAAQKGGGNKHAFHTIVDTNEPPGVLAYIDSEPVGWCAVAPRADYPALERSRILRPVTTRWSGPSPASSSRVHSAAGA